MIKRVTARAYANIALVKYWGKIPGLNNIPATPSVSLTLKALKTETVIERNDSGRDQFILNGIRVDKQSLIRMKDYLDYWRNNKLIEGGFLISSNNNFPTKAGLASSSSGFAALAVGLGAFAKRKISRQKLSRLARIGSGSSARSIVGGLAALPTGSDPAARLLIEYNKIPWGAVIAEVESNSKKIDSRTGMELCRKHSPYYKSWVTQAMSDYKRMLKAVNDLDFTKVGEIAEANALAMHACMIAARPSLMYWSPVTFKIIQAVRKWRDGGLEVYFTIDAGPHVVLLGLKKDIMKISKRVRQIEGIKSVIKSEPVGGAEVIR